MKFSMLIRSMRTQNFRKKVLAVFGLIIVYRLMSHIPIPLTDGDTMKAVVTNLIRGTDGSSNLGFLDILSGGALTTFSIMLIGMAPYINASIIIQLLTQAIPKLYALNQEGEFGRKKISQYTRMLTLPLAIMQSIGAIFLVRTQAKSISGLSNLGNSADIGEWVLMVSAIVAGSMILMWIGELITEQGIANGISLIITTGIVASLPNTMYSLLKQAFTGEDTFKIFSKTINYDSTNLWTVSGIFLAIIIMIWIVVKLNEARKEITIHYAKRVQGAREYGGVSTVLPVKLITAGVIPIIFALSFLAVPNFVGELIKSNSSKFWSELGLKLVEYFTPPTAQTQFGNPFTNFIPYIYPVVYFLLVVLFTYFYTSITFNSKEIAENLQKQGGFIEGVRSGKDTEKYLARTVSRLTFFGALALGLMALVPTLGQVIAKTSLQIEGTTMLILVAVAIETLRKLESKALMLTYDDPSNSNFVYAGDSLGLEAMGQRKLFFKRNKKNKPRD